MAYRINEVHYESKEISNEYKTGKMTNIVALVSSIPKIHFEIPLILRNNKKIKKYTFFGPLTANVREIKSIFKEKVILLLKHKDCTHLISEDDLPFLKLFEIRNGFLLRSYFYSLIAIEAPDLILFPFFSLNFNLLKKLIIKNIKISKISLLPLPSLKYIKLINNRLKSINSNNKKLEFCQISNNLIKECTIMAKVMILNNNKISKFKSDIHMKFLNISYNPLEELNCSVKLLLIKHTKLKSILNSDAHTIIADYTKKIKIGKCPNLKVLSLNNTGLSKITFSVRKLSVFKANNNQLQNTPKFKDCKVISVSGNFLEHFKSCNATTIDLSKNQIRTFDFNNFLFLKHINLSFNPLDEKPIIFENNCIKTILINQKIKSLFLIKNTKITYHHQFKKSNHFFHHYKIFSTVKNTPVSMFVTLKYKMECDLSNLIINIFDQFRETNSFLNLLFDFSDCLYFKLFSNDPTVSIMFTLITEKNVSIRSFYLPTIYYNFFEIKTIDNPNIVHTFKNSSAWFILPVFCKLKVVPRKRTYLLSEAKADLQEILQFINFNCLKSLDFLILNLSNNLNLNMPSTLSNCISLVKAKKYTHDSTDIFLTSSLFELNRLFLQSYGLGLANHDFGLNIERIGETHTVIENPLFLLLRMGFKSERNRLIQIEKCNLFHIFDFYSHIFKGVIVEKSYRTYIIQFNVDDYAVLFALKIEKLLKLLKIQVSIGISTGLIFTSQSDGFDYIGGPVFNKSARLSDMGTGVFCCSCLKLQNAFIEIVNEGDRYFKGFEKNHRLYSLKLAHKF